MLRALVATSVGIAAGIFGFAAGMGVTGSWAAAALVAAMGAGLAFFLIHTLRLVTLDAAASSRPLLIVSGLATLVGLVLLARLTVFMVDPSRVGYSINPASKWEVEHSCLTAYFVAAEASSSGGNVYDGSLYTMPDDDPNQLRKARMLGRFKIDVFEYPPQFLLLPLALRSLTPQFVDLRMLWFALNGGILLLALLVVAQVLGPVAGTRALLLSPLLWMALPTTISTLQKGNVQIMVIAATILAMVLFARRRWVAGGALLAFATVSKIYPSLLIVYLLARRQWRAAAWTASFAAAFSALTWLALGWGPYAAFLDHLPGLLGGEAFPAFRNPAAMAINFSIPGLVFKLKLLGVPGMSFDAAKIVGWGYTIVAGVATVVAGWRASRDGETPQVWLAILILATLRSPFLPQSYAVIPVLWLLTLLAASDAPMLRAPSLLLPAWIALNIYWPNDWPMDPAWRAVMATVPQALTVSLVVVALRRRAEQPDTGMEPATLRAAADAGS